MRRLVLASAAMSATMLIAACSDSSNTNPSSQLAITMASTYAAAPAGFSSLTSSFAASGDEGPFMPGFGPMGGHGHGGFEGPHGGPGFGLGFMGGGLFGPFLGDGVGPFFHSDSACTYASGTLTCNTTTRDGLTVKGAYKYTTAAGVAQQKRDSTTDKVVSSISVSGTETRHRDSSTSVVSEASNQTISGLAYNSTKRTISGTTAGTETTTGTSQQGAFTAKRTAGDTVTGVVIPVSTDRTQPSYPTAGSVTRSMSATVTITGQAATTSTRREVITYDGSATAKVVITQDGTTQNCTLPLPHGHLTCS